MFTEKENEEWYQKMSEGKRLPDRCPHADPTGCFGYYCSISLLQKSERIAGFSEQETRELKEYWERNKVYIPQEDEPALSYANDHFYMASKFCPEITKWHWGYYADLICVYADELDQQVAHKRLREENVAPEDYRWNWETVRSMHFTDCPFYKKLSSNSVVIANEAEKAHHQPEEEPTEVSVQSEEESCLKPTPDYRSVTLRGNTYHLTPFQAKVIRVLHEEYLSGNRDGLSQQTILERVYGDRLTENFTGKIKELFRNHKEIQKALIESPKKGIYLLKI